MRWFDIRQVASSERVRNQRGSKSGNPTNKTRKPRRTLGFVIFKDKGNADAYAGAS